MIKYEGYKIMHKLFTSFLDLQNNNSHQKWHKLDKKILDKLVTPNKDFNDGISHAFSAEASRDKLKNLKKDVPQELQDEMTLLNIVVGKYSRRDYYTNKKWENKTDYFFTFYLQVISEEDKTLKIFPAKYVITQREYKSWLINDNIIKNSQEILDKSKLIEDTYNKAYIDTLNNHSDDDLNLDNLF